MELTETGRQGTNLINLTHGRYRGQALINTVTNLSAP